MRSNWAVIILFTAAIILSACDLLTDAGDADIVPEPTATVSQPFATSAAPNVPNVTLPVTPTQGTDTLRVWIPPEVAARTESGASILSDQILTYNADHPQVTIIVEQKRVTGSGGILSYLRTARDVAPSILPDLIAIPADLLPAMSTENLVYPLEERFDDDSIEALFPPALALGQPDSGLLGYPFALHSLPQLAYNSNVITGTLPLTWDRMTEDPALRYIFAADGLDGALLVLQFYLDGGGRLVDENGQPALEQEPLAAALQYLEDAREKDFFAAESATISTTDQTWQSFLSGAGNIAQTTADHFLGQSVSGLPIAYTVIPGIDRPLTPLVDGWVWAVTTSDLAKQEEAVNLIQELVLPNNLAAWSYSSNSLPARRDAFDVWPDQDPHIEFVRQELDRAQPLTVSSSGKLMTVLSDAVFQIISKNKTAEQAAVEAVNAMKS